MTLAEKATVRLLAHRLRAGAKDAERHLARRNLAPDVRAFVDERVNECRALATLAGAIADGQEPESRLVDLYARIGQLSGEVTDKRAELKAKLEVLA